MTTKDNQTPQWGRISCFSTLIVGIEQHKHTAHIISPSTHKHTAHITHTNTHSTYHTQTHTAHITHSTHKHTQQTQTHTAHITHKHTQHISHTNTHSTYHTQTHRHIILHYTIQMNTRVHLCTFPNMEVLHVTSHVFCLNFLHPWFSCFGGSERLLLHTFVKVSIMHDCDT